MTTTRPDLATLMLHQEWVRSLAHRLVRDGAAADDIAQQTMLEAVARAPGELRQARGWLTRVVRNAARAFVRGERRRTRREQFVAQHAETAAIDPAVTVQRAAAHKRVVDTLFALAEPYHTVVLLRFFEDIDAHEIGRRLGRPVATVRTQLQRGLQQMRERLDGEFGGDRRAWCVMLAPLLPARAVGIGVPLVTGLGALSMTKWMLAAAAGLLGLTFSIWQATTVRDDTPVAIAALPGSDPVGGELAAAGTPAAGIREAASPPAAGPAVVPTPARQLQGRLVSVEGQALAGVTVASRDPAAPYRNGDRLVLGGMSMDLATPAHRAAMATPEGRRALASHFGRFADEVVAMLEGKPSSRPRTTTDGFGRFVVATAGDRDALEVETDGLLLYGSGTLPGEAEPVFVAGPAVSIAGVVRDARGAPLEGVFVHVGFTLNSLPGIGARLRVADRYASWNATTKSDGTFALGRVPALDALQVSAQKRGHAGHSLPTSSPTLRGPVDWTLADDEHEPVRLAGIVRHADGRPAAAASVCFGQDNGQADAAGRFAFALTCWSDDTPLQAYVVGYEPCVVDGLGKLLRTDAAAGAALELRLGGPARSIVGRVVDADGRPLAGFRVVPADGQLLGTTDQLLENCIADQGDVFSDGQGRFELRGLGSRPYTVRAIDPRSLLVLAAPAVAAGTTDLELRVPADAFLEHLDGMLVDRRGAPIAGARVELRAVLTAGRTSTRSLPRRDGVKSDTGGRFRIEHCPRRSVQLAVLGDGVAWKAVNVPEDGQPVRIEVVRMLRFRLTPLGGSEATAFEVHDAAGRVLRTTACRPGLQSVNDRQSLRDPAPVYEVDDAAATLVLFRGEQELRREVMSLRLDDVTEIAW